MNCQKLPTNYFTLLLLTMLALTACDSGKTKTNMAQDMNKQYLLIGSYNNAEQEGIKVYCFDEEQEEFRYVSGLKGIDNPSFVYPTADGKHVYAVGENVTPDIATAHTLSFDAAKGELTLLNTQAVGGDAPCNIIVSQDGRWAYTSNYFGASITEFPIDSCGLLQEGRVIAFEGKSVDPERQTRPYLHAVNFSLDGKYLLADDLGTDRIHVFRNQSPLDESSMQDIAVPEGVGPRHLCFSPDGRRAYLLGELSGDVVTLGYDGETFEVLQTLRADSLGAGGSADIHCSPDGQFVYASHRLKGDGISILKVNPEDGLLKKVGYQPTGIHPRNFTLTRSGKYLLVACRDTDEVQLYKRDSTTGLLTDTNVRIQMHQPVCLQWIP